MDHAAAVRFVEPIRDLRAKFQNLVQRQRTFFEALRQRLPFHAFHDQIVDAILMANHGVVTYGEDLLTAYMNMETVEHYAKIALVTHMLGKQKPLSDTHVSKLREIRQKYLSQNHVGASRGDD